MAVKQVLLLGNPLLREKSKKIEYFDDKLQKIIIDLRDTLKYLQEEQNIGRALAAPQIDYRYQVIYYNHRGQELIMINPEIIEKSDEMFEVWDSCFSLESAFFVKTKRHQKIEVLYQDETGQEKRQQFSYDLAELFQHEIDHLEGILATNHLQDNQDLIMRAEWEKRYK